jgi:hypothetical protein
MKHHRVNYGKAGRNNRSGSPAGSQGSQSSRGSQVSDSSTSNAMGILLALDELISEHLNSRFLKPPRWKPFQRPWPPATNRCSDNLRKLLVEVREYQEMKDVTHLIESEFIHVRETSDEKIV